MSVILALLPILWLIVALAVLKVPAGKPAPLLLFFLSLSLLFPTARVPVLCYPVP